MKNNLIYTYAWPAHSPIAFLECEPTGSGSYKARMIVNENSEDPNLSNLPRELHKYGFSSAYADVWQEKNALVIPSLKEPKKLIDVLSRLHCVSGIPRQDATPRKISRPVDTLKASGRAGLIGHAALMAGGAFQGEWGRVLAGPLGASTAGILAKYGNGKSEMNFDEMLEHMHQYFAAEGVALPPLNTPENKRTIIQSTLHTISKHPIPLAYGLGSVGAAGIIHSGWMRHMETRGARSSSGLGLMAAGISVLIGSLIVLFVPEKKKPMVQEEENQTPHRQLGQESRNSLRTLGHFASHPEKIPSAFTDFVSASPLRFNGILNFINNIFYFIAALDERKTMQMWKRDHPEKIFGLKDEMKNLLSRGSTRENALRIAEIDKEIPALEKQLKLASSWQGKIVPYLTLCSALSFGCATMLSAISSEHRNAKHLTNGTYERLYALVSKIIVQMPPDKRDDMIQRMSTFLAAQEDVKDGCITSTRLAEEIKKRVTILEHSPWIPHRDNHVTGLHSESAASFSR